MAALRSIAMQLKGLPQTNICCLRSSLCLKATPRACNRQLMPVDQFRNQQIDFCARLYRHTNRTCFRGCALIEQHEAVSSQLPRDPHALAKSEKIIIGQTEYPNLDLKVPIRQVIPVSKEIRNISYISDEFRELLRKHDEEMQRKYILSFLPEKYTSYKSKLKAQSDTKEPHCICEESAATAADKTKATKRRNFFKMLSCCTKSSGSVECQCVKGKQGECEMCSQRRLTKKSNLKKHVKKSKEKNVKVAKAKSVEILKGDRDLQNRYWVGTEHVTQEMGKRNKRKRDKKGSKCCLFRKASANKIGK